MSQPSSGSNFSVDGQTKKQDDSRQNGRASVDITAEIPKNDMSNGFEIRANRPPQALPSSNDINSGKQLQTSIKNQVQQNQQSHVEERPPSVPVMLSHQPYHDNIVIDRVQFVSQGGAQPISVHPGQFQPEYVIAAPADSIQYSHVYNPQYVSRDMYSQNVAMAAQQGTYVQQPPQTQPPGQAPTYYAKQGIGLQPTVAAGYVHFGPQIHYSQYPQTVMNPAPYNPQKNVYPQQYTTQPPQQSTSSAQHSPNPQRYSQEYQGQPIIQPIAQNIAGHSSQPGNADRPPRGPKPMVPPRVNSKITSQETGHRKSASVDVPSTQKPKAPEPSNSEGQTTQDSQHQQVPENQDRRYGTTVNQTPRTRQDGLYVDANGEPTREQVVVGNDAGNADCGIYVSRSEHRKSVSVDVTSSFQRRNDTITFTFPGDAGSQQDSMLATARKPVATANVVDNKPIEVNVPSFPIEQRRLDINPGIRMSPMPFPPPMSVPPKGILVSGERKSVEWSSLSPNQRVILPQENRRSDYFEDHRRSPMTIDGKRFDEVRRSPMTFVPIRDANAAERLNQKSPNNMATQHFDKTRADLAMWAEQRQRQEIESRMMFTPGARSRNPSEERRPESRSYGQIDKENRLSMQSSAFQPIANITPNSILEQRRHLRHVSADLTKHMEFARKEFDEQPLTGSVVNLGTTSSATSTTNVMTQRASPNICFQYPSFSEAKLDTKLPLSIVTDFNEIPSKPLEQVDHIIHSHRKSHNQSNTDKNNDKSHNQQDDTGNKIDLPSHMHGQQTFDFISEKLSQCERQQSDLHAKLQSLQNQNDILDKVAAFQFQQSEFQQRMQNLHLQSQLAEKLSQRQSSEFTVTCTSDDQDATNQSILNQCINASRQLYQHQALLTTVPQLQSSYHHLTSERVSPRLQYQDDSDLSDSIQIPSISQMPLPSLSQFDRADVLSRTTYAQLQRMQQQQQNNSSVAANNHNNDVGLDGIPCSQMSLSSLASANFTGTLKKVPPEKPPRTSLLVQSPDTESNRSQPAIGLKHTSKARVSTFPSKINYI